MSLLQSCVRVRWSVNCNHLQTALPNKSKTKDVRYSYTTSAGRRWSIFRSWRSRRSIMCITSSAFQGIMFVGDVYLARCQRRRMVRHRGRNGVDVRGSRRLFRLKLFTNVVGFAWTSRRADMVMEKGSWGQDASQIVGYIEVGREVFEFVDESIYRPEGRVRHGVRLVSCTNQWRVYPALSIMSCPPSNDTAGVRETREVTDSNSR
ncbi:hypothetical protein NEOLEDRAFT_985708 [Neolentinus lepideus HHB14362 ss-1]|uniref:Uncharacterized protein n=1 Tax=Neolentinus lepideus HHB14362 ss-1 TaxID=1314782 RepID=A0A165N6A4_9AGAM|nr:hypothetical protein NEOLEDRAFT_985708 [Neolentinus lepideus HHB14362 ss-1]